MDSIISTFHIDWKIIIAQAVNFAVVFTVLYIFALKPLSKLMKERSEKIQKGIADAKRSDEMLKQVEEEFEKNNIKLRQISIETNKELKKELQQLRDENLEVIKADTDKWQKNRLAQMEIDKKTLVRESTKEIVSLATAIASKVTGSDAGHFEKKILEDLKEFIK